MTRFWLKGHNYELSLIKLANTRLANHFTPLIREFYLVCNGPAVLHNPPTYLSLINDKRQYLANRSPRTSDSKRNKALEGLY